MFSPPLPLLLLCLLLGPVSVSAFSFGVSRSAPWSPGWVAGPARISRSPFAGAPGSSPGSSPGSPGSPLFSSSDASSERELTVIKNPLTDLRSPDDGKIRVPLVPVAALALAGALGTTVKMRENQMKMKEKKEEAEKEAEADKEKEAEAEADKEE